jgi:hypothetical protein
MDDKQRLIDRIRKLLKLSESANEHEAAAAAAKAHALLSEYNLSVSDVSDDSGAQGASRVATKTRQRLERWAFNLAAFTADAFDCSYFHSTSGKTTFVGVGPDPEVCAWTFSYLYKSMLRMASAYMKTKTRLRSTSSKNAARASYLSGAVAVVGRRLLEQKAKAPVTSDALVPIKTEAVKAAMPEDVREKNFKDQAFRADDVFAGALDARRLPLSTPVQCQASPSVN